MDDSIHEVDHINEVDNLNATVYVILLLQTRKLRKSNNKLKQW